MGWGIKAESGLGLLLAPEVYIQLSLLILSGCFLLVLFPLIWEVLIQIVPLVRSDLGLEQAPFPALFKGLGIPYFPEDLHGWFVYPLHYPSSFLDFYQFPEIPRELLCQIEIELDILGVDEPVVHDLIQQPLIHILHVTPDLLELVGSMVKLPSLIKFEVHHSLLENV